MKEKFDKIVNSKFGKIVDWFCNSPWYAVAFGATAIICHTFELPVLGAAVYVVLLAASLVFCKNSYTLLPFLLMCAFVISKDTMPNTGYYNTPARISVLCILLAVAVACFVFNVVYYKKYKTMFKRSYLTVSIAVMTGFLLLGGVGTEFFSWTGIGNVLAIGLTAYFPYSLLLNCGEYKGKKSVEYFGITVIVASVAIACGFLYALIKQHFDFSQKAAFQLGYVGPNTGSAILVIALPILFYFIYNYKHGFWLLLAVAAEICAIMAVRSRASLVVAVPGSIIVAIALCFKKKNGRVGYFATLGAVCAALIIGIIIFRHKIGELFDMMFDSSLVTGSGRTDLWRLGFEGWNKYPVLGVGLWYLPLHDCWYYSFHCTPLTYLYCGGIFGFAAYVYHRYKTVRLVFSAKLTTERVFLALTVFAMLVNALLDIAMTSPLHLLYYGAMFALVEADVKKTKAEQNVVADATEATASAASD